MKQVFYVHLLVHRTIQMYSSNGRSTSFCQNNGLGYGEEIKGRLGLVVALAVCIEVYTLSNAHSTVSFHVDDAPFFTSQCQLSMYISFFIRPYLLRRPKVISSKFQGSTETLLCDVRTTSNEHKQITQSKGNVACMICKFIVVNVLVFFFLCIAMEERKKKKILHVFSNKLNLSK